MSLQVGLLSSSCGHEAVDLRGIDAASVASRMAEVQTQVAAKIDDRAVAVAVVEGVPIEEPVVVHRRKAPKPGDKVELDTSVLFTLLFYSHFSSHRSVPTSLLTPRSSRTTRRRTPTSTRPS